MPWSGLKSELDHDWTNSVIKLVGSLLRIDLQTVSPFMLKSKTNNLPQLFQDCFFSTTDIHKFAIRQAGRQDFFLPRSSSKFAQKSIKVCGVKV